MKDSINVNRGYLYILGGLIILLYVLGFISKALNIVLSLVALGLIVYGIYHTGIYDMVKSRITKKH